LRKSLWGFLHREKRVVQVAELLALEVDFAGVGALEGGFVFDGLGGGVDVRGIRLDGDLNVGRDFAVDLDGDVELAGGLERLVKVDLAAVDEAL
jgi:hypothetical protein